MMNATIYDHDEALRLCALIRATFPVITPEVDQALIELNEVCLSHTTRESGPVPELAFARARSLLGSTSEIAPSFEVIEQHASSARVRTSSGRLYGLSFDGALWRRGYLAGETIAHAMRGAA